MNGLGPRRPLARARLGLPRSRTANVLVADVAWDRCLDHLPSASQAIVSGLISDRRDAGFAASRTAGTGGRGRANMNLRMIADPRERRDGYATKCAGAA